MLLLNSLTVSPVTKGSVGFSELIFCVLVCPLHDVKSVRILMNMIMFNFIVRLFQVCCVVIELPITFPPLPHESFRVVLLVNILFIDKTFKLCLYFLITSLVLFVTTRRDSRGSRRLSIPKWVDWRNSSSVLLFKTPREFLSKQNGSKREVVQ
jgi:hypothetical protein